MRTKLYPIIAAALGLGMIGLAGSFDEPAEYGGWGPSRQAHEEREFHYGPKHEVCNSYGGNCMVCDSDNDYCRRMPSGYAPYPGQD
jgi:hypothetical protein